MAAASFAFVLRMGCIALPREADVAGSVVACVCVLGWAPLGLSSPRVDCDGIGDVGDGHAISALGSVGDDT